MTSINTIDLLAVLAIVFLWGLVTAQPISNSSNDNMNTGHVRMKRDFDNYTMKMVLAACLIPAIIVFGYVFHKFVLKPRWTKKRLLQEQQTKGSG
jgi:hypothetical protein